MPDEPTTGELVRRLEAVHADLKEDLHQLSRRLDGRVSADVFELRMKALERDIAAVTARAVEIEAAREKEREQAEGLRQRADERRRSDRRLAFTALIAPLLLLLLQLWVSTRGAAA